MSVNDYMLVTDDVRQAVFAGQAIVAVPVSYTHLIDHAANAAERVDVFGFGARSKTGIALLTH